MKIYHTETQADYDALMVELEVKGIGTLGKRYWEVYENQTVVIVHALCRHSESTRTDTAYGSLEWALKNYLTAPQKYKAKADEKMRFTKENVLDLTDKWIENKTVSFQDLQNEIKELDDTPEKVVVPKCFDEWFKEIVFEYPITDSSKRFALWKLSQQGFGCGFERANGEKIPYDTDLGKWLFKNRELAINAVLNGYTIERERFYCIPLPHLETADGTKQYLTKSGAGNYLALSPCIGQKQRYTKEELEQVPEIYKPFAKLIEEEE